VATFNAVSTQVLHAIQAAKTGGCAACNKVLLVSIFFLLLISFGLFFCAVTFDMIILKIPARTLIGGGFLVGTTAALLSGIDSTKQHHRRAILMRNMS
jgi:hypothetical protein